MNREIKFRVWDKKENEWVVSPVIISHGTNVMVGRDRDGNPMYREEIDIQQYTGLKDKNGKEIYEGDILRENLTLEMASDGESANVGRVFFAAGTFMIDGDGSLYEHTYSLTPDILEDYLVVGNVFENPELLK